MSINEISEGFANLVKKSLNLLDRETIMEGNRRYKHCETCPHNPNDTRCEVCGCFLKAKVLGSKSKCPIGKW